MRHLPNILTLFRLLSAPLLPVLICGADTGPRAWAALLLFCAAALSDHLDGYLARRLKAETAWGRELDPLADKLLIAGALLGLTVYGDLGGVHLAAVAVILLREIAVSGAREWLALRGAALPVTPLARVKTVAQSASIGLLLAAPLTAQAAEIIWTAGLAVLWAAAALTAWTGARYLRRTVALLRRPAEQAS